MASGRAGETWSVLAIALLEQVRMRGRRKDMAAIFINEEKVEK